mgnify:FL=1
MDIWQKVIDQIKADQRLGDTSALYEMLQRVPKDVLINYLPEDTYIDKSYFEEDA